MRLLASGLRQLVRRRAAWVTVGLLIGLFAMILIAVGGLTARQSATGAGPGVDPLVLVTFPGATTRSWRSSWASAGMFAIIYCAIVAGSEWSWGKLKSAVARGESRRGCMVLTFASISVRVALGFLLTFLVGILAALFLPDVVKYLPFDVAKAAVTTGASQGSSFGGFATGALGTDTALLLVGVWLAAPLTVTALFTERTDITG